MDTGMKKKLTIALFAMILLATALPTYAYAEECTKHQWGEWNEIIEATCIEDGLESRSCEECYEEEWRNIPAIGYHIWGEWVIEQKSTCKIIGWKSRKCAICDEEEVKRIPVTEKHSWKSWDITKKATALSEGKKSRFCATCGKVEKKTIPRLKASVSLKEQSVTIESGKSHTLKIKSRTYGDKVKKWESSNKTVATVTSSGKVTGNQVGTATITLEMKSGVKATCKIYVTRSKQSDGSQSGTSGSGSNQNNVNPSYANYVWIPNTGRKYHKSSSCSGMRNPTQVTVERAVSLGYEPCRRCY